MSTNLNFTGLSPAEACSSSTAPWSQSLAGSSPSEFLHIVFATLREPMFLLLLICSEPLLIVGDTAKRLLLSAAFLLVIAITLVQEQRAERTLDTLRDLSSPGRW